MKNTFDKARKFIYRNARPLDLALWRHDFESGSAADVYAALEAYQNDDGGFGHGIEPDFWNVNSSPIATWCAITKLKEVGVDGNSKLVKGILGYLESGKDFSDGKWHNVIPTNNAYPHAVWWHCNDGKGVPSDNPTVSLAGFVLRYGDHSSALYKKCVDIAKDSVRRFIDKPTDEGHSLRCYLELYEYCLQIESFDLFDLNRFKTVLFDAINKAVCQDSSKWFTEYVSKPSTFFDGSNHITEIVGRELCEKECELIVSEQLDDGSYPVTWLWYNDYSEYYVSKNIWKSDIVRQNMLFLRAFGKL